MKKAILLLFLTAFGAAAQELVPFGKNGQFGFKKEGREVIPASYEYACNFTEGLALVKSKGLWGFIDTLGQWKIPAVYEKSEPFFQGGAIVILKGKAGMIGLDGKYLIQPENDDIRIAQGGFLCRKGNQYGFFSWGYETAIPAIYTETQYGGDYVNARNGDGTWDFYYKGKRLIQSMDVPAKYENASLFEVRSSGLGGLYHLEKGWTVPANYELIDKIDFPSYVVDDVKYNYIYVLYEKDPEVFLQTGGGEIPSIRFAKVTGELISEKAFTSYSSYIDPDYMDQCKLCIVAQTDSKITVIGPKFKLTEYPYTSLKTFMEWYIAYKDGQNFILDKDLQVMDSFASVKPYIELQNGEDDFDENFEPDYREVNEAFLMVSSPVNGIMKTAVYDLYERKVVSEWFPADGVITVQRGTISGYPVYIYGDHPGLYGYYTHGMAKGSPVEYEKCETFKEEFLLTKKSENNFTELFTRRNDSLVKVLQANEIFPSQMLVGKEDLSGESERRSFMNKFLFLYNPQQQCQVICSNGKVSAAFDDVLPNESMGHFVTTVRNGKYGALNIFNGDEIAPFHTEPMVIDYLGEDYNHYYTKIGEGSQSYYLNQHGKKFFTMHPEAIIFKEKGLYGLKTHSDFSENIEVVVPPRYQKMEKDPHANLYVVSNRGKKGVIDIFGDTVVGLKYSGIENLGVGNYIEGEVFLVRNRKKTGLYSERRGELIPVAFDRISPYADLFNTYLVEKSGKQGIYSGNSQILPCEYKAVDHAMGIGASYVYYLSGIKNNKLYVQPTVVQDLGIQQYGPLTGPYDLMDSGFGYNIEGDHYRKYDLSSGQYIGDVMTLAQVYTNGYFQIVNKQGKWGATDFNGKELVPFIYESASFMTYRNEVMIGIENGIRYYIYVDNNERYTEEQW